MAIFFSKVMISLKELETHPAFTCSKLPMQTPEKSAKPIQYSQQRHQSDVIGDILISLLLTSLLFFIHYSCASIAALNK